MYFNINILGGYFTYYFALFNYIFTKGVIIRRSEFELSLYRKLLNLLKTLIGEAIHQVPHSLNKSNSTARSLIVPARGLLAKELLVLERIAQHIA